MRLSTGFGLGAVALGVVVVVLGIAYDLPAVVVVGVVLVPMAAVLIFVSRRQSASRQGPPVASFAIVAVFVMASAVTAYLGVTEGGTSQVAIVVGMIGVLLASTGAIMILTKR